MGDQGAVPADHGLGTDQPPYPAQHVAGEPVQQRCEEGPISRIEPHPHPHPLAAELALQHHDLVAQRQDLYILGPVARRQQPQHRERVRHAQVRQS
jgi:hypothetical protein